MRRNIFVVGLDDLNLTTLQALPDADRYAFHQLLTVEELRDAGISIDELLARAGHQLDTFDGTIDAIVGYWDFPVSLMVPVLCRRHGLRSADLSAVVRCEHKYWSRLEQQKVVAEVPAFALLPTGAPVALPDGLHYPVWVKPVKSASSEGATYAGDDAELRTAAARARTTAARLGPRFEEILARVDLPSELDGVGGAACVVEEAAGGHQFTVEGYARAGHVRTYGVVDSLHYPGVASFLRYQYPSRLPAAVLADAERVTERVITAVGLDSTTFNIEYFWDETADRLTLLEINTRHSQSHALLFQMVDGVANHACMLDLALGREPHLPRRRGAHPLAAKWFLRTFAGGVVRGVPGPEILAEIERTVPGTTVHPAVTPGTRLERLHGEDSYSYVLAEIYTGGRDEAELTARYEECVAALRFEIDTSEGA